MTASWERALEDLAMRQEHHVGRHQLDERGLDPRSVERALRSGRWRPLSRRVIHRVGMPETDLGRAWAGVLDAGPRGRLHGTTVMAHVGVRLHTFRRIHVAVPRGRTTRGSPLAVVHHLRELDDDDVTRLRGVPCEPLPRALWSVSQRFASPALHDRGVKVVGRLADDLHGLGVLRWDELQASVERLERRGRPGTVVVRRVSDKRPPGSSPTESRLEDTFEEIVLHRGIRTARQAVLGGSRVIGRCDFRLVGRPVAIEINSLRFHTTPSDVEADLARYEALVSAGFGVAVIWEDDLWSRREAVVRTVLETDRRARARRLGALHSPGCPWPHGETVPERWVPVA